MSPAGPAAPVELRGLYAITAAALCADAGVLLAAVEAALRGGARLIQYRDKQAGAEQRRARASALLERCRAHGAQLIVNDDLALARAVGAHGVHLGAADAPVAQARAELGPHAIVGASCGPSLARAEAAVAAGASYVAFGRLFPSLTKPEAPPAGLELLGQARARWRVPICAIGGITAARAGAVVAAGADLVAAVDGIFGNPEPAAVEAAARAYSRLFAL